MTHRTAPHRPTGLSGQEEEDLRALEKGYDPEAGALPDPDPRDDPTRKPGDDALPVHRAASDASGAGGRGGTPSRQPDDEIPREGAGERPEPLGDARTRGLLPSESAATPPMDRPDNNTGAGPANLDPDPDRRMP